MLSRRELFLFVFYPTIVCLALDQLTKQLALELNKEIISLGLIELKLRFNHAAMLGAFSNIPPILRVVSLATIGVFVFYCYLILQYLLPIKSLLLRCGLAIFVGSILGNVLDRVFYGYVIDFLQFHLGSYRSGIMNIADILQWLGVGMLLYAVFVERNVLWPPEERRGRKWVNPEFQLRYCLQITFTGFAFSFIYGAFAYSFLRTMRQSNFALQTQSFEAMITTFLIILSILAATYIISLFIIGLFLSHRIAGPIFAFEKFLDQVVNGKNTQLKLRQQDEFAHLEEVAERFQSVFHDRLGMDRSSLEEGATIRGAQVPLETLDSQEINLQQFVGKKIWLAFYRYATCPVCIIHMQEVVRQYDKLQKHGVQFLPIFENSRDQFIKPETGATADLLQNCPFPLIADPEKKMYQRYRTKTKWIAAFHPQVIRSFRKAKEQGYLQGSIDGELGQIPAHFLINEAGKIEHAYSGKTVADHISWDVVWDFAQPKSSEGLSTV